MDLICPMCGRFGVAKLSTYLHALLSRVLPSAQILSNQLLRLDQYITSTSFVDCHNEKQLSNSCLNDKHGDGTSRRAIGMLSNINTYFFQPAFFRCNFPRRPWTRILLFHLPSANVQCIIYSFNFPSANVQCIIYSKHIWSNKALRHNLPFLPRSFLQEVRLPQLRLLHEGVQPARHGPSLPPASRRAVQVSPSVLQPITC